jgi:hypothetical protein
MDGLPFHPEDQSLTLQRQNDTCRALESAIANLRRLKPSIEELLGVVERTNDGLHWFARSVDFRGTSLFGLCLRALPTRMLRSLLFQLESKFSNLWSTRLGSNEQTLLHLATRASPPLYVLRIIAAHDEAKLLGDQSNELPIHYVCTNPAFTTDYIAAVLDTKLEALRRSDAEGRLPLHVALGTVGRGEGTGEQINAIWWMIKNYTQAQTMVDNHNKTPFMVALHEYASCRNLFAVDMGVGDLFDQLAEAMPASLRATRLRNGVQDLLSTALHVVSESCYIRKAVADFVLEYDDESLQCQDYSGELPLHKVCRRFADFDGKSDVLNVVNLFVRRYGDGLHCRNLDGLTPLHLAIASWGETALPTVHPPIQQLLTLIKMATPATVRGTDRRLQGRSTSASCLEYAYEYTTNSEIRYTLYEMSPIEILLMDRTSVGFNELQEFDRASDRAFVALLEIILHPTFFQQTLSVAIHNVLSNFFPEFVDDDATPHSILSMLSEEPLRRDLRNLRDLLIEDNNLRDLLFNDLGPGEARLAEMVRALWRADFCSGRLQKRIDMFRKDKHCLLLAFMSDNPSAVYLHLHYCVDILFPNSAI